MVDQDSRPRWLIELRLADASHTFESFDVVEGTEACFAAFKTLAEGTGDRQMLFCYGPVGNGKTHLCEATVMTLYKRGIFCRYWAAAEIFRNIKSVMGPDSLIRPDDLIENLSNAPGLMLDDWKPEQTTAWEMEVLEEIIRFRYRQRLITVMTSNRDLPEIEARSERLISRFSDPDVSCLVLNAAPDYRRR